MEINRMLDFDEKPLDNLIGDGGFCSVFRSIGCIGDSLSSGEFEVLKSDGTRGYYDMYEYSWGQFIARTCGSAVYNFSKGGMTAKNYFEEFAEKNGFWDKEKACQAYIIAMGVNDLGQIDLGSIDDMFDGTSPVKDTFVGYYSAIIKRLNEISPEAKLFFMTIPKSGEESEREKKADRHAELLYEMSERLENSYVLDFRKYAPVYDSAFRSRFFLNGHLNPMGYALTAKMVISYIDYIIRHNMKDFERIGLTDNDIQNYVHPLK